jgi:hypothetical protein
MAWHLPVIADHEMESLSVRRHITSVSGKIGFQPAFRHVCTESDWRSQGEVARQHPDRHPMLKLPALCHGPISISARGNSGKTGSKPARDFNT